MPVVDEALLLSASEAPLKHDWREYRLKHRSGEDTRGLMCAKCACSRAWGESEFPQDFKETYSRSRNPCLPGGIEWIDESPMKESV